MHSNFVRFCLVLLAIALIAMPIQADAEVEWQIENTLKTGQPPLDVAIPPNGQWIFVLTADGNILIYSNKGNLEDTIQVGPHIDQIRAGPSGEQIYATSRQNQTVEVIALDFVRKINVKGSPFMGRVDAPVIVTVFSDFQ